MLLTQKFIFMSLTFLYNYIFKKICVKKRNLIGISLLLLQIGQNIICIIFKNQKYIKIRKTEKFKISSKLRKTKNKKCTLSTNIFFSLNNYFNLFSYITWLAFWYFIIFVKNRIFFKYILKICLHYYI